MNIDKSLTTNNAYMYYENPEYGTIDYFNQAAKSICSKILTTDIGFTVNTLLAVIVSAVRERDSVYFKSNVFKRHCRTLGLDSENLWDVIKKQLKESDNTNTLYSKESTAFFCPPLKVLTGIKVKDRTKIIMEELEQITEERLAAIPEKDKNRMALFLEGMNCTDIGALEGVSYRVINKSISRIRRECIRPIFSE